MANFYLKPGRVFTAILKKNVLFFAAFFCMQQLCAQAPTIASFSPTAGNAGSSVTITGTNFSTTPVNNIVYFGAVKAVVSAASNTALTVTVPTGASYQPITVTVNGLTAYATKPFVVTFPGTPATNSLTYFNQYAFTALTGPYSTAVADFNGDGKTDVAVAGYNTNTIIVAKNTSNASTVLFGQRATLVTGNYPKGLAEADLDGDGLPDLVVANQQDNTVSTYRNTSTADSILFAAKTDYVVGSSPGAVVVKDIDADGKPDIIATNYISASVSVFKNTSAPGSISFAAKIDFTTAAGPASVAISDIDGDGLSDIITANTLSSTMSVLKGTGTGIAFAPKVDYATGSQAAFVSMGDIDNDGKPDAVIANTASNTVSVLLNTSSLGSIYLLQKQMLLQRRRRLQLAWVTLMAMALLMFRLPAVTLAYIKTLQLPGLCT